MIDEKFLGLVKIVCELYENEDFKKIDLRDVIATICLGFDEDSDVDTFWSLFTGSLNKGEVLYGVDPVTICERILARNKRQEG